MPLQVKKTSNGHKVTCVFELCLSASMMKYELNARISRKILKKISFSEISHLTISSQARKKNK